MQYKQFHYVLPFSYMGPEAHATSIANKTLRKLVWLLRFLRVFFSFRLVLPHSSNAFRAFRTEVIAKQKSHLAHRGNLYTSTYKNTLVGTQAVHIYLFVYGFAL